MYINDVGGLVQMALVVLSDSNHTVKTARPVVSRPEQGHVRTLSERKKETLYVARLRRTYKNVTLLHD